MRKNLTLSKRDLLTMENELLDELSLFFSFDVASLYFPTNNKPEKPTYLEEEEKLLLPLKYKGSNELLAVVLARKPNKEELKRVLPCIEGISELILEKLSLKKAIKYDATTELYTKYTLIQRLTQNITNFRENFSEYEEKPANTPFLTTRIGILYFHFADMYTIARRFNAAFAEECMHEISLFLLEKLPYDAVLARVNTYDCALLLNNDLAEERNDLNEFIHTLCLNASALNFTPPAQHIQRNQRRVSCAVRGGYVLFPQDFDVLTAERSPKDLAYSLLAKAQLAAQRAFEQKKSYLPFNTLIQEAGNIVEVLPHNRFLVNLGKNVGLKEGMSFSVYAQEEERIDAFIEPQKQYKGEIHIVEIFDEYAIAEQTLLYDPTFPFTAYDSLIKLPDDYSRTKKAHTQIQKDALTQLYKHADFLSLFSELRQSNQLFTLSFMQIEEKQADLPMENLLAQAVQHFMQAFVHPHSLEEGRDYILSRYSNNGILLFLSHTKLNKDTAYILYQGLAKQLNQLFQQKIAIGIAEYPFLHYRTHDALENSKKALEYAKLLDFPHVGFCDSLALTISADKLATQGLLYEAMQEYQNALLADENNALAQNSLGVTLVSLGRHAEAQNAFLRALELTPDDISIPYNLGGVSHKLGDIQEAKSYYLRCLDVEEYSYFAHIKLGQLAEVEEDISLAKDYYEKAIEKNTTHAAPYRNLASIALEEENADQAREYLHTALRVAPHDSSSLALLAKLYLNNEEDPALAATLLSPIMHSRQKNTETWKVYIQALKAQGKFDEVKKAENILNNL